MNIYIDCEWDGYRGPLLSLALCAADGREFYGVLDEDATDLWVKQNVIPILGKKMMARPEFDLKLAAFLQAYEDPHIIADWPEDLARFCDALITGPGERLNVPQFTMEFKTVEAPSQRPHNALWDARAIRDMCEAA